MARQYAGTLGLLAFTTTLLRAVVEGGTASSTIPFAVGALVVFALLGYLFGTFAERTVDEAVLLQIRQKAEKQEESR